MRVACATDASQALIIILIVNIANLSLVCAKVTIAYTTGSFNVANSALETFGDVFVGFLLLITRVQHKFTDEAHYPHGRSTEAITNVIASVVMMVIGLATAVLTVDKCINERFDPHFEHEDIAVIIVNIVLKILLFLVCTVRKDIDQVNVLRRDQGVDVITNSVTVAFAFLTKYHRQEWDILGAALILVTIYWNWIPTACENAARVHGVKADDEARQAVEKVIADSHLIASVHRLTVFHWGAELVVEVFAEFKATQLGDIRLAREMLTRQIEELPDIHAAYVFDEANNEIHIPYNNKSTNPFDEEKDSTNPFEEEMEEEKKTEGMMLDTITEHRESVLESDALIEKMDALVDKMDHH